MKTHCLILLAPAVVLTACSSGLPKYSLLGDLRVLAMKVDQPEVSAGGSATITPWVSDLNNGANRTLSYVASGCVDPGIGYGAQPSCASRPDQVSLGSGAITLSAPNYTGAAPSISVSIPTTVLGTQTQAAQFLGVAYLVTYNITASDGTTLNSFKRIMVSTNPTKNTNPTLTDIYGNGVSLTTRPTSELPIEAVYPASGPGSPETYQTMQVDGTIGSATENFVTTWFISDGSLQYQRTDGLSPTNYTPATPPATRGMLIIGVLRDGRGGEDIKALTL